MIQDTSALVQESENIEDSESSSSSDDEGPETYEYKSNETNEMEGKLEEARNEGKEEVASNQIKEVVKEEVKDKAVEIREGKQELEETEEIEEKVEVANVQSQPKLGIDPKDAKKKKKKKSKGTKKPKEKKISIASLFRYADTCDRIFLFFGICGSIIKGCFFPALIYIQGNLINSFNNFNMTQQQRLAQINNLALWFVILGCIGMVGLFCQHFGWSSAARRQAERVRSIYFRSILRQDIAWYDAQKVGSLSARIEGDTIIFQQAIGEKFALVLQFSTQFVAALALALYKEWRLALVIIAFNPLLLIISTVMVKHLIKYAKASFMAYAAAGSIASDSISGIRTLVSFSAHEKQVRNYDETLLTSTKLAIKKRLAHAVGVACTMLTIFFSYGIGLYYGGILVVQDNSQGGDIVIVFFAALMSGIAMFQLAPSLETIGKAQAIGAIIFETIDRVPAIDSFSEEGLKVEKIEGKIEFNNLQFTYPARPDIPILKGFNLIIKPGQVVALVGPSGAGKSSVISLIQRFYDPNEGSINFDDYDLKSLNVKWLRSQIGVVGQEPVLFSGSIADNIRWGKEDATQEEIEKAAKAANAHKFITQFPDGYNTSVGEKGAQLSGGQKQRIAIARAIIKNPKILLLDEATSALDTESEAIVQEALDSIMGGRTTIVVAHRLSTIRNADLIVVMEQGQVVEQGTHEELMKNEKLYFTMVKVQGETKKGEKKRHEEKKSPKQIQGSEAANTRKKEEVEEDEEEKKKNYGGVKRVIRMNSKELPILVFATCGAIMEVNIAQQSLIYMGAFFAVGFYAAFSIILNRFFFGWSGEKYTHRLRVMTFKAILRHDVGWFDDIKNNTGNLTAILANDCTYLENLTNAYIGIGIKSCVAIAVGIAVSFYMTWELAYVIVACYPVVIFAYSITNFVNRKYTSQKPSSLVASNQLAYEAITNIRTVASFTAESRLLDKYNYLLTYNTNAVIRRAMTFSVLVAIGDFFLSCTYAIGFWRGGHLIVTGGVPFQHFMAAFLIIMTTSMTIGTEIVDHLDVGKGVSGSKKIFKLLDYQPTIDALSNSGDAPETCSGTIEIKDLFFRYPTRQDLTVLNHLSLEAKPRQVLALVGYSGCGKSSVIQLIERFYDPAEGNILLDGHDLRDLNPRWLRSQIGLVGQEPVLFSGSIADNIRWGKEDATQEEIEKAAKAANAHKFITQFPDGYNTSVGEKGAQLSGGQKQRIAIARAIIKNPKILLLDEATSALDTESEKIVQKALDKVMEGRTTIVVAHRLSTIKDANMILVMDRGQIVEQGTFEELMNMKNKFYALVQRQT